VCKVLRRCPIIVGPIAALLATIFLGIVIGVLSNF